MNWNYFIKASGIQKIKLQLHDAIYRLRFYSNSLIHILLLSDLHNNVASIQKNRGDKSHRVIVALPFITLGSTTSYENCPIFGQTPYNFDMP